MLSPAQLNSLERTLLEQAEVTADAATDFEAVEAEVTDLVELLSKAEPAPETETENACGDGGAAEAPEQQQPQGEYAVFHAVTRAVDLH